MKQRGRPLKEERTIARQFKITPEQNKRLTEIVLQKHGVRSADDRSHVVRLALEDYFKTYYD